MFDRVLSPGDFTGDGAADVLARKPDGTLWLYPGNGGAAGPPRAGGSAWAGRPSPTSPCGDRTGDGRSDVLALRTDGTLLVYPGNGRGGWASGGQTTARGWDSADVGIR